ncbi:MAG TPA: hypothetical protein VJT31_34950 [Rugosimonospora sp.]|nr:hypothetical protein [Rugosimonospora sp.]
MNPPEPAPTAGPATHPTPAASRGRGPWTPIALIVIAPLLGVCLLLHQVPGVLAVVLLLAGLPVEWKARRWLVRRLGTVAILVGLLGLARIVLPLLHLPIKFW